MVNGGIVVMDPHTGKVIALVGGFQLLFRVSLIEQLTKAKRQPGSKLLSP